MSPWSAAIKSAFKDARAKGGSITVAAAAGAALTAAATSLLKSVVTSAIPSGSAIFAPSI